MAPKLPTSFVRKKTRTIGHVFVAMLALKLCREFEACLKRTFGTTADADNAVTLQDALGSFSRLCFQRQAIGGQEFLKLPRPDERQQALFKALDISPPASAARKAA